MQWVIGRANAAHGIKDSGADGTDQYVYQWSTGDGDESAPGIARGMGHGQAAQGSHDDFFGAAADAAGGEAVSEFVEQNDTEQSPHADEAIGKLIALHAAEENGQQHEQDHEGMDADADA